MTGQITPAGHVTVTDVSLLAEERRQPHTGGLLGPFWHFDAVTLARPESWTGGTRMDMD